MSRFHIEWTKRHGCAAPPGYVVFDRSRRITVPFATREEAELRCANIVQLYARWGW